MPLGWSRCLLLRFGMTGRLLATAYLNSLRPHHKPTWFGGDPSRLHLGVVHRARTTQNRSSDVDRPSPGRERFDHVKDHALRCLALGAKGVQLVR